MIESKRHRRRAVLAVPLLGLVMSAAGEVRAQPSGADQSLAQSLFEQGKKLMAQGNYREACPKLAESQRIDPGGGTLLNLALCHEKEGKVATAWTEFKEALSAARRDGRKERIAAAEQHIAALEPQLPWLTLEVAAPAEGQDVKLAGATVGAAAWGAPFAVDPGTHEIKAVAPGRKTWTGSVRIGLGEKSSVAVPELAVELTAGNEQAKEPAASDAENAGSTKSSGSRTAGWIVAGAGVASLGVGTFFGIRTLSKKKASDELCPTDTTCTDEGVELNQEAKTSAWIANIGIGLGLVGVGVGTYLLISSGGQASETARTREADAVALDVKASPWGGKLELSGTW